MKSTKQITEKLKLLQEAYHRRAVNEAEKFIADLFHTGVAVSVLGTSDKELNFDIESIKQLFISDWKHWSELNLHLEEAIIRVYSDCAWVHLPGTVRYSFSDNEETYSKFIGYIEEFFDGKSYDAKKPEAMKLTEINWLLAHLLHPREPKLNREYLMDLRLFLVFTQKNDEWKVSHIRFSVPKASIFADQRFSDYTPYEESYQKETEQYEKHSNYESLDETEKQFLQKFRDSLVGKNSADNLGGMFTEDSLLIGTGKELFAGKDSVLKELTAIKSYWDELELNIKSGIYHSRENTLHFHTNGVMRKRIRDEELFVFTAETIKKNLNSSKPAKDKLFLIRKAIATTLYEQTYGEEYIYPYRFDAFLSKKMGQIRFDYIQLSYPFNTILEQINDDC